MSNLIKNEEIFFTSDTHFSHKNIIKYCNRPFNSIEEMDEKLIQNWNSVIKPNDSCYHLGDVCFGDFSKIRQRLNGKIYLIKGNHDRKLDRSYFEWVRDYYELQVGKQSIILSHYAFKIWNRSHHNSYHLYGHSHGTLPEDDSKSFDVGVDSHDYYPWNYDEIEQKMTTKKGHIIDHHGEY